MRPRNDGILHRDGSADRNGSGSAAHGAGVRHDHAAVDHGHVQQLRHAFAHFDHVVGLFRGLRLDRFGEGCWLMTPQSHHQLFGEFFLEFYQQGFAVEALRLELTGAAKRGAQSAPFMPAGRDQVACFDFHVHCRCFLLV